MQNSPQSLLNSKLTHSQPPSPQPSAYKIYALSDSGSLIHTELTLDTTSVKEAVEVALLRLELLCPDFKPSPAQYYELFLARKNGKKNEDFPSLEWHQPLAQFNHHRFFLENRLQPPKFKSITSFSTDRSLPSAIDQNYALRKNSKQQEIEAEDNFFGCFCRR